MELALFLRVIDEVAPENIGREVRDFVSANPSIMSSHSSREERKPVLTAEEPRKGFKNLSCLMLPDSDTLRLVL